MPVATQSRIGRPQERAAGHSAADTGGLGLSGLVMEDKSAYVTSDYLDPAINTTIPAMQPSQLMVWSPWQLSHCLTETTLSACSWPVSEPGQRSRRNGWEPSDRRRRWRLSL